MQCEEVDELLAAFAMNRLDREEDAALAAHLRECSRHDTDLAELRAVVSALPYVAEELAPPPGLKTSLLEAFDNEVAASQGESRPGEARAGFWQRLWRAPQLGYALAAGLAVVAIGLAAWNLSLQGDDDLVVTSYQQGSMNLRVLYLPDEGIAVFEVSMPPLSAGRTYQAWKITEGGAAVSLGVLSNQGTFAFESDLSDATAIAISVEPSGGSPQPTSDPVVVSEL
jgi:anti-sigma-K factor RskA